MCCAIQKKGSDESLIGPLSLSWDSCVPLGIAYRLYRSLFGGQVGIDVTDLFLTEKAPQQYVAEHPLFCVRDDTLATLLEKNSGQVFDNGDCLDERKQAVVGLALVEGIEQLLFPETQLPFDERVVLLVGQQVGEQGATEGVQQTDVAAQGLE